MCLDERSHRVCVLQLALCRDDNTAAHAERPPRVQRTVHSMSASSGVKQPGHRLTHHCLCMQAVSACRQLVHAEQPHLPSQKLAIDCRKTALPPRNAGHRAVNSRSRCTSPMCSDCTPFGSPVDPLHAVHTVWTPGILHAAQAGVGQALGFQSDYQLYTSGDQSW